MPKAYHGVLHPVLVTAVVANAGLALQGKLLGIGYAAAQKAYLAKVRRQGATQCNLTRQTRTVLLRDDAVALPAGVHVAGITCCLF